MRAQVLPTCSKQLASTVGRLANYSTALQLLAAVDNKQHKYFTYRSLAIDPIAYVFVIVTQLVDCCGRVCAHLM